MDFLVNFREQFMPCIQAIDVAKEEADKAGKEDASEAYKKALVIVKEAIQKAEKHQQWKLQDRIVNIIKDHTNHNDITYDAIREIQDFTHDKSHEIESEVKSQIEDYLRDELHVDDATIDAIQNTIEDSIQEATEEDFQNEGMWL